MMKEKNTAYGIDEEIELKIRSNKPFTMLLRRGNTIFERCFNPLDMTASNNGTETARNVRYKSLVVNGPAFKHVANTYKTSTGVNGTFTKLTEHTDMGISTVSDSDIFITIRALEINGYTLTVQDWKVM